MFSPKRGLLFTVKGASEGPRPPPPQPKFPVDPPRPQLPPPSWKSPLLGFSVKPPTAEPLPLPEPQPLVLSQKYCRHKLFLMGGVLRYKWEAYCGTNWEVYRGICLSSRLRSQGGPGSVRLRFRDGTVQAVLVSGSGGSSAKRTVPVPASVPGKWFRRFRFRFWFREKRFRRFRFPVPVRFLSHPVRSQEGRAIPLGGALRYKLEVYCGTFQTSCTCWGLLISAHTP